MCRTDVRLWYSLVTRFFIGQQPEASWKNSRLASARSPTVVTVSPRPPTHTFARRYPRPQDTPGQRPHAAILAPENGWMSTYIVCKDFEGRVYVAVPDAEDSRPHHIAYARNTQEALQIIHYLNGGSDPAAAAVVAVYEQTVQELPTPVADVLASAVHKVKNSIPRRRRRGEQPAENEADA